MVKAWAEIKPLLATSGPKMVEWNAGCSDMIQSTAANVIVMPKTTRPGPLRRRIQTAEARIARSILGDDQRSSR